MKRIETGKNKMIIKIVSLIVIFAFLVTNLGIEKAFALRPMGMGELEASKNLSIMMMHSEKANDLLELLDAEGSMKLADVSDLAERKAFTKNDILGVSFKKDARENEILVHIGDGLILRIYDPEKAPMPPVELVSTKGLGPKIQYNSNLAVETLYTPGFFEDVVSKAGKSRPQTTDNGSQTADAGGNKKPAGPADEKSVKIFTKLKNLISAKTKVPGEISKDIEVTDPLGVHLRVSGSISKKVKEFSENSGTISKEGNPVDASDMLSIMTLGIEMGDIVTVSVKGDNPQELLSEIEKLLAPSEDEKTADSGGKKNLAGPVVESITPFSDYRGVEYVGTEEQFGDLAAKRVGDKIVELQKAKQDPVTIILATGNTQIPFLHRLAEDERIDWDRMHIFHLDEYRIVDSEGKSSALPSEHVSSFAYYINENLIKRVEERLGRKLHKENIHYIADHINSGRTMEQYMQDLNKLGGADIEMLGVGPDGHLAFNEKGKDFSFESRMREAVLEPSTIEANRADYPEIEDQPYAYTMGMKDIVEARNIFFLVRGQKKDSIVKKAFNEPVTEDVPASILQKYAGKTNLIIGEGAASSLLTADAGGEKEIAGPAEEVTENVEKYIGKAARFIAREGYFAQSFTAEEFIEHYFQIYAVDNPEDLEHEISCLKIGIKELEKLEILKIGEDGKYRVAEPYVKLFEDKELRMSSAIVLNILMGEITRSSKGFHPEQYDDWDVDAGSYTSVARYQEDRRIADAGGEKEIAGPAEEVTENVEKYIGKAARFIAREGYFAQSFTAEEFIEHYFQVYAVDNPEDLEHEISCLKIGIKELEKLEILKIGEDGKYRVAEPYVKLFEDKELRMSSAIVLNILMGEITRSSKGFHPEQYDDWDVDAGSYTSIARYHEDRRIADAGGEKILAGPAAGKDQAGLTRRSFNNALVSFFAAIGVAGILGCETSDYSGLRIQTAADGIPEVYKSYSGSFVGRSVVAQVVPGSISQVQLGIKNGSGQSIYSTILVPNADGVVSFNPSTGSRSVSQFTDLSDVTGMVVKVFEGDVSNVVSISASEPEDETADAGGIKEVSGPAAVAVQQTERSIMDLSDEEILALMPAGHGELRKHAMADWKYLQALAKVMKIKPDSDMWNMLRVVALAHDVGGFLGGRDDEKIEKRLIAKSKIAKDKGINPVVSSPEEALARFAEAGIDLEEEEIAYIDYLHHASNSIRIMKANGITMPKEVEFVIARHMDSPKEEEFKQWDEDTRLLFAAFTMADIFENGNNYYKREGDYYDEPKGFESLEDTMAFITGENKFGEIPSLSFAVQALEEAVNAGFMEEGIRYSRTPINQLEEFADAGETRQQTADAGSDKNLAGPAEEERVRGSEGQRVKVESAIKTIAGWFMAYSGFVVLYTACIWMDEASKLYDLTKMTWRLPTTVELSVFAVLSGLGFVAMSRALTPPAKLKRESVTWVEIRPTEKKISEETADVVGAKVLAGPAMKNKAYVSRGVITTMLSVGALLLVASDLTRGNSISWFTGVVLGGIILLVSISVLDKAALWWRGRVEIKRQDMDRKTSIETIEGKDMMAGAVLDEEIDGEEPVADADKEIIEFAKSLIEEENADAAGNKEIKAVDQGFEQEDSRLPFDRAQGKQTTLRQSSGQADYSPQAAYEDVPEGVKLSINEIIALAALTARRKEKEGKDMGEELIKATRKYLEEDAEAIAKIFVDDTKPRLVRVPVEVLEALEAEGDKDMGEWLALFNGSDTVYVELYTVEDPELRLTEQAGYGKYGLEYRVFPDADISRTNTVTLLGAVPEMADSKNKEIQLKLQTSEKLKNSIIVPLGIKGDAMGVARSTLFGFRLMNIARNPEDKELISQTVVKYNNFIESYNKTTNRLSAEDILALVSGMNSNNIVRALKKIISMLPIKPLSMQEKVDLNAAAKQAAMAA